MLAPAGPCLAQGTPGEVVQPISHPEAERLAQDMATLAADPRNLSALISAGQGSLKLDDPNAALGFFLRAQDADPRDARAKAGLGSALVHLERPAEALRMFQQAAQMGLPEAEFAGDRGLAYDLVGDQARAQHDYSVALRRGSDDEITRRFALSLGISGKREAGLALLEPLIRKQDRAAWRSRAFILAMTGDEDGAQKVVRQTLPAGMAAMLTPYLVRLDDLGPGERAFAVHYGRLGGSGAQLARQSAPQPTAPVQTLASLPSLPARPAPRPVATAAAPAPRELSRSERRAAERARREAERATRTARRRDGDRVRTTLVRADTSAGDRRRDGSAPTAVALAARAPVAPPPAARVATSTPSSAARSLAPTGPPAGGTGLATSTSSASRSSSASVASIGPAAPPRTLTPPASRIASATVTPTPATVGSSLAPIAGAASTISPIPGVARAATPAGPPTPSFAGLLQPPAATVPVAPAPAPAPVASAVGSSGVYGPPVGALSASASPTPGTATSPAVVAAPIAAAASPAAAPPPTASPPAASVPPSPATATTAPASTPTPAPATPAPAPAPAYVPPTRAERTSLLASIIANVEIPADELKARPVVSADEAVAARRKAEAAAKTKAEADERKKTLAAADARKKAEADAAKKAEAKKLADARKAKAAPQRHWVQIATGANPTELAKDFRKMVGKSPVLKGQTGWSARFGGTRRMLVGPFASQGAAVAYMNKAKAGGVDGFNWTSPEGAEVEKLPGA